MHEFSLRDDTLFVEDVALNGLIEQFGTPSYVYSKAAIVSAYRRYTQALSDHPGAICYAVKANSNIAILQVLAQLGAHFDIVSIGELQRVLHAGGQAERIIFSGVGKTREDMRLALKQNIACFNVESEAELRQLSSVATDLDCNANISLRVNPDVDAKTHPYISTGLKENKFGVAIEDAPRLYQLAQKLPGISIVGVDCHIGSQLTEMAPFMDALDRLLLLIDQLAEFDIHITHLDLGGGIGVRYREEQPPAIDDYIARVKARLGDRQLTLLFEPGRSIVGNAGALLTEVIYLKPGEHKNFAIVDAAMNDNIRPALYQAWQEIRIIDERKDAEEKRWDIVGPVCETADFLAKDRQLALSTGTRLAMMSSGAYCFVMASNYNTRCRPPEILVDRDTVHLIRRRETFEDLVLTESLLETGHTG